MKKLIFVLLICALPKSGKAQITAVGLTAGVNAAFNNSYTFQAGDYIVELESMGSELKNIITDENLRLNFGTFLEHDILAKYSIGHGIILHQYYPSYYVTGSPSGDKKLSTAIFAIKYNGLFRFFNKGGVRLMAGVGIDINIVKTSQSSNFSDDSLNEIISELQKTFRPLVYYAGAELGYRAGRIDIALRFNHSLSSFTQPLVYQGETYGIPTRSAFLFFNVGFLVFDKNLRNEKRE